jgi:hypothetical protein
MKPLTVNRYLYDRAMDHIDHALGRPLDPLKETYRNHFAAGASLAAELDKSPHWEHTPGSAGLQYFRVTDAGRQALADHLKAIRDPHRAFRVTVTDGDGDWSATVVAKSHGQARYLYWLELRDCSYWPRFGDFLHHTSCRLVK